MGKRKKSIKFDGKLYHRRGSAGGNKKRAQKWAKNIRRKENILVRVKPEITPIGQKIYMLYQRSK